MTSTWIETKGDAIIWAGVYRPFLLLFVVLKSRILKLYVDETGDLGLKVLKGSSKYFGLVLIQFNKNIDIERTTKTIDALEKRLHLSPPHEWHFSNTQNSYRNEFYKAIKNSPFLIKSVFVDKQRLYTRGKVITNNLYLSLLKRLLNNGNYENSKLVLDKSSVARSEIISYVRNDCKVDNSQIIDIKTPDSKKEKPLQIADMVAGAIHNHYKSNNMYYSVIKKKIIQQDLLTQGFPC